MLAKQEVDARGHRYSSALSCYHYSLGPSFNLLTLTLQSELYKKVKDRHTNEDQERCRSRM